LILIFKRQAVLLIFSPIQGLVKDQDVPDAQRLAFDSDITSRVDQVKLPFAYYLSLRYHSLSLMI
jgi:hypothetical protein